MVYKSFLRKKFTKSFFFRNFAPTKKCLIFRLLSQKRESAHCQFWLIMNNTYLYQSLYRWYRQHHRALPWRDTTDPYKIWISEIILQQTRVAQGIDYYLHFIERFPDTQTLANAHEDEVLRYWQGLGYYSRARNLHKAAQMIVNRRWLPFPTTWEDIRQLTGIGDYTAGAIASFAYNLPYPAMDGNVYRVIARLYDCDIPFDTTAGKKHFHRLIEQILDRENPRLFNSAIMEFGALYCTPNLTTTEIGNICEQCPIAVLCKAHIHHTAELLPVRKPRPVLKDRYLNYYIFVRQAHTLIRQRRAKDIWQHLYEFPLVESDHLQDKHEAMRYLNTDHFFCIDLTHILSHQRLHARFFVVDVKQLPTIADSFIVPIAALDNYAFSRLTLRALENLHIYEK